MDSAEELHYFSTVLGSVSDINFCSNKNAQGNPPIGSFKNFEFVPLTDSDCRFSAACSLDGRMLPSNWPNLWNLCSTEEGFFSSNFLPATPRHNPFPKSAAGVEKDTNVVCNFAPFTPDLSAKRLQNAQSTKSTSILYDEKLKGGGNDGSCQHNVDLSIEEKGVPPSASVFLSTQLMEKANIDMADHHLSCIDLNKTPSVVKPRRKKHRPKVVGERKRKQSPIVVTCDQATNKVTKTYMRKRLRKVEDPSQGNVEEGTVQSVGTTVDLKTSSVQSVGATVGLETFRIGDLDLSVEDQAERSTNILDIEILSKGDGQCGSCQPNVELFSEGQVVAPSASAFSFTPLKDMHSMDMGDLHRRDIDLNKTPPSSWKKNWSTFNGEGKLKSPNLVIPQQDGNKEMKTYLRKRSSLGKATPQANVEEGAVQSAKAREGLKTAGRQSLNFNLEEEEGVVQLVREKQSLKTSCRQSLDFNFVDEPGRPANTMADEILSKGDGQDGGCQPNVEVFGEEQVVPQGASFFSFTPLKDTHNMYMGDLHKRSIDLNKTPPLMKPRRKKHRPKVIGEGKPKKSPKIVNPNQAGDKDVKTYRRERSSNGKVTPQVDVEEGAVQSERTRVGLETSCRRVLNLNVDDQPGGLNYVGSCTSPPDLVASSRSSLMDQKLEVVNSSLNSCNSMGYITKGLKRKFIETFSTDHIEPGIIQDNGDYFPLISKKKRSNGRKRIRNCEKLWNVSQTTIRSCSFTSLYEINHFTIGFEVCMEALRTLNQAIPRKNRTKKSCLIHVAQPESSPVEVVPSEPIGEIVEICVEMIELLLSSSVSEVSVKALETQNQATPRKKRTMKGHPHILAKSVSNSTSIMPWEPIGEVVHSDERTLTLLKAQNALVPYGEHAVIIKKKKKPRAKSVSNSTSIVPWEPIGEVVHSDERMLTLLKAQNALVPYGEHAVIIKKKKKPRAKVYLDEDTNRVWAQLMWKEESQETEDEDNKEKWKEERQIFHGRVDSFIARMRLVQGERRFSRWKGSVVDSVVGVFLTQNVSDHLSSSAFMALVSRFQFQSRTNCGNTAERAYNSPEEPKVSTVDSEKWQDKLLNQGLSDQGSMTMHEYGFVEEEMEHSIESVANNVFLCTADYSKDKQTIICENGQKMTQESEEGRTYIARELEDVISQNSTGLNFNIADKTGLVFESNPEVVNVVFMELLQMQEEKRFKELNHHGNRSLQSDVTCEGANTIELSSESSSEAENVVNRFKSYQFMDLLQMQEHKVFPEMNHQGNMSLQSDVTVEGVDVENTVSSYDGGQSASGLPTHLATLCHTPQKQEDTLNTSKNMTLADPESVEVSADEIISSLSSTASEILQIKHSTSVEKSNGPGVENATEFMVLPPCSQCDSCAPESELRAHLSSEPEFRILEPAAQMQDSRIQTHLPNFNILGETVGVREWSRLETTIKGNKVESSSKDEPHSFKKGAAETAKNKVKGKVTKNGAKPDNIDWDSLRRQAYSKGPRKERSHEAMDTLDYEAVRCSDVNEISDTIRARGMNNRLAERIKDFLNRLVQDHGSIDLEWLRDVPPDKTKDYLLSIRGLGLKSVECVRLLALHHVAFPVDTNVARICVRLGWVPLEPLPESVQMHLLEMYPFMDSVQKYLWPRLCKLDELTLYELHYQMITFGKVFCTKSKPNCNACPMRGECKHFASAFASARLALPRPEEKGLVTSAVSLTASEQYDKMFANLLPLPPLKRVSYSQEALGIHGSEPIIEEPASPEHGTFDPSEVPMEEIFDASENEIEDSFWEENPDEIPTIKLNMDEFYQNVQKYMQVNIMGVQDGDVSKALVALTAAAASIPMPKLKNVSRLRTEHLVYELPDSHTLLKGLDPREPDDICPYLLAIWSPGETAQSTQPHVFSCNSQDTDNLCDKETCYACNTVREANAQTVRGTLLIPCRTAMRGSFPLNGTYFQINEMFADHESSLQPIDVPRTLIWNLPRRTVYFGTSVPTIFRGLTTEEIQLCFWRGFICVRGFDRKTRAPRPLIARLHFPASKQMKTTKGANRTSEE